MDEENWRPKPFRMLKCWADMLGYKQFVTSQWRSFQIQGLGGFVLKEKFKMFIRALRLWHSKNLPGRISSLKDWLSLLDGKREVSALTEAEIDEVHTIYDDLKGMQQSRMH